MTDGQDTSQAGTLDGSGSEIGGQTDPSQNSAKPSEGDGQNFLLNYATAEDAARGFKEAQSKITELAEKNKALAAQSQMAQRLEMMEKIQEQAQLSSVNAAKEMEQRKAEDELNRMRQMIEEDPTTTVDILNDLTFQHNQRLASQEQKITSAFEERLETMKADLDGRFLTTSPEYQLYSEEIGKLKSQSSLSALNDAQLLDIAKTTNPDKVSNMAGSAPMGTVGGVGYQPPPPQVVGYDEVTRQGMKEGFGWSDQKIAEAEARYISEQKEKLGVA